MISNEIPELSEADLNLDKFQLSYCTTWLKSGVLAQTKTNQKVVFTTVGAVTGLCAPDLKTVDGANRPGVRIPPSPPDQKEGP